MAFGIERRARSRKAKSGVRAWFGGAPDAQEVGDRLVRLARRLWKGALVDVSAKRATLRLHPAAPLARVVVLPDGDLEITASTSRIGPGYHRDVLARIQPLLDELDYVWAAPDPDPDPGAAMLAWLADELRAGVERIGMPGERAFVVDRAVQTALGPRDAAWRDAVIADPAHGRDAFAWWDDGPGAAARSRALLAMSLDVPWREPLDDRERELMEQIDADLRAARAAEPDLALPWAEWAELLQWVGEDDEHAEEIRARAHASPVPRDARLGYRRHAMQVALSGSWTVELGGNFVGRWEDDGARWWATDGDRAVEFTSLTATADLDSDALLAVAPEAHPVVERFASGDQRGRAEVHDEDGVYVVHGLMARSPEVGILVCKGKPRDHAWALATWRSLTA